jgi:hypothetical protein
MKRYKSIEEALDPTRPIKEVPTFIRGKTGGKYLCIIYRVQVGLPLSTSERDFVSDALRRYFLTAKEYNAYRRIVKLKQIEITRKLAEYGGFSNRKDRAQWVRDMHGYSSPAALKQFVRRERKHRR